MRIEEQPVWDRPVSAEEAEENAGRVYVPVHGARWEQFAPRPSGDVARMVAPPVGAGTSLWPPAVEPTLHFASAEVDPALIPAFLAPAPVSPAAGAGGLPATFGLVTWPVSHRRRRRTRG